MRLTGHHEAAGLQPKQEVASLTEKKLGMYVREIPGWGLLFFVSSGKKGGLMGQYTSEENLKVFV